MNSPTQVIDPDGELVIVLRNFDKPFAEETKYLGVNMVALDSLIEKLENWSSPTTNVNPIADLAGKAYRIQVSAKHLALASSYFKTLLGGSWKETTTPFPSGFIEIAANGWGIDALLILLRIVHFTVLADYYQCKEALGFFSQTWIAELDQQLPTTYGRDLILWLWVSWFFGLSEQFLQLISTAMSTCDHQICSRGLPISGKILDERSDLINQGREQAIGNIIDRLFDYRAQFLSGSAGCHFECSSIMYGTLSKAMESHHLLSLRPVAPYRRLGLHQLVKNVKAFKSPEWCTRPAPYYHNIHQCAHSSFASLFGELNGCVAGLELSKLAGTPPSLEV
ncbi:uncharacterized protein BO97DRAFT_430430 [Aspergillus homomorphus CBS 101889]|uniref:BTB domain-containing protein n=1 Tax=Aspergillus homomorphus (strain CBS 101889) TaxID=1450537 RepID=A0A395IB22_ASPHC|nr:hypothetical protein BO97DRAFT_430430 [Aspergillus homomorphus CBS 101889]RAL17422.1 hypothetical protein BO97DRAFT_430430 [Aspergillus homomorphus CBS 101889]